MVGYTFYESDNRVIRYAETLCKRGDQVDVLALRREGQSRFGVLNGVNIYRIQERSINETDQLTYLWRILKFFIKSFIFLSKKSTRNKYDLIHIHSIPDFEVFSAGIPKLFGSRIILDIHDLVPEFYVSKFHADQNSILYKTLTYIEKLSIAFSDHVIISNHMWEKKIVSRSVKPEKCNTILNYPDPFIFNHRVKGRDDDRFILMYPGSLNWHQGLDIAIEAFSRIADRVPHAVFHIYGEGPLKDQLVNMTRKKRLDQRVKFFGPVSIEKIARIMKTADLGVIPKRNDFFGGEAFSTKTLEFMLLGVPIVLSRTKIDSYYYNDNLVTFFQPENPDDLAKAMLKTINDKDLRERQSKAAYDYAQKNSWSVKSTLYFQIVNKLVEKGKNEVGFVD